MSAAERESRCYPTDHLIIVSHAPGQISWKNKYKTAAGLEPPRQERVVRVASDKLTFSSRLLTKTCPAATDSRTGDHNTAITITALAWTTPKEYAPLRWKQKWRQAKKKNQRARRQVIVFQRGRRQTMRNYDNGNILIFIRRAAKLVRKKLN